MSTEENTTVDAPTETPEVVTTSSKIINLITSFEALIKESRSILSQLKAAKKEVIKLEKKKGRRTRDPNRPKKPATGFARPVPISDELADFLEIERGELIPRTGVLQKLNTYIKAHNLQRPEDRRKINLDLEGGERLRDLLNIPEDKALDFFNLQTYLKPHFIKNGATTETTTPAAPTETAKTKSAVATAEVKEETTVTKKRVPRTRKKRATATA